MANEGTGAGEGQPECNGYSCMSTSLGYKMPKLLLEHYFWESPGGISRID